MLSPAGNAIKRLYALGRGRTDLLIVWPQGGRERRFVVECKVLRKDLERTITEGVEQTRGYIDRCGAEAGHLVVFDRAPERPWAEKIFRRPPSGAGVPATVWGTWRSRAPRPHARVERGTDNPSHGSTGGQHRTTSKTELRI